MRRFNKEQGVYSLKVSPKEILTNYKEKGSRCREGAAASCGWSRVPEHCCRRVTPDMEVASPKGSSTCVDWFLKRNGPAEHSGE